MTDRNYNVIETSGVPIFLWNKGVTIEEEAIKQLTNLAQLPFVHHHVAAMPDTHAGIGATVGSVFASKGAVVPAAVGVDIGCGMIAAKTNLRVTDLKYPSLIRNEIERGIPMGRTNNGGRGDRGAWENIPEEILSIWETKLEPEFLDATEKYPKLREGNLVNHLGTLGTGNHFIEIQKDTDGGVWIMLHSGSRGPGNRIGSFFIKKAKELMEQFYIKLPDKDLAYIPEHTELYGDYIKLLRWAQNFAFLNRQIMLHETLEALQKLIPGVYIEREINTHHNYAAIEKHFGASVILTRKGAINADKDAIGIIPGSMGDRSYIVRGLGNRDSFLSCSHGAGRAMSRTEAKKRFTVEDHAIATSGIECRKDIDVIDETPAAYKRIDEVIEAEKDLVEPIITLSQIVCCKG